MYEYLAYFGLFVFAVLAPSAFFARYCLGKKLPWWVVGASVLVGSWAALILTNYFYSEYVCQPVRGVWNPDPAALERCTSDGGRNVSTYVFGWLYGLLYAVPCSVAYGVAQFLRNRRDSSRKHAV